MAQTKIGVVVSDKMQQTVIVKTTSLIKHPLYKKQMSRSSKFKAQNKIGAKLNDKVKIMETKPVAKTIHFKVLEILEKGK